MKPVLESVQAFPFSETSQTQIPQDSIRLFHGRGQCYPGLNFINVDWYQPVLLITLYQQPELTVWDGFVAELQRLPTEVVCVLVQRRYLRDGPMEILRGELPEEVFALEQDLRFSLSFGYKQNIGFFPDMLPGRQWLKQRAAGKRVLNLFAYTCSLSVAAIAGDAHSVVNVDMSRAALNIGRDNHRLNNQAERLKRDIQFLSHDIFRSWRKIINKGPYDIVLIDPPSRQKGSFIAEKDYQRVIRRLSELLPKGGDVLACLNAPELDAGFLTGLFAANCPPASLIERLSNRMDFPERDAERNLKLLHYRLN